MEPYSPRRKPRQLQVLNNSIVPFAPSAAWYAAWWQARRNGLPDAQSVAAANIATGISGKDYARCRIKANGNEILLSVAIEGGAARLKRRSHISSAQLSDHGNWRHVHLGAIEAAYGRAPYFQHLFPIISDVYSGTAGSLADFTLELHKAISGFLSIPEKTLFHNTEQTDSGITAYLRSDATDRIHPEAIYERASELAVQISPHLSIIDPLMHLGTEILLPLTLLQN